MNYLNINVLMACVPSLVGALGYSCIHTDAALANPLTIQMADANAAFDDGNVSFSAIDLIDLVEMPDTQPESSGDAWAATPNDAIPNDANSVYLADWPVAQAPVDSTRRPNKNAWQVTLWGGPLTDADIGEALLFDVDLADSYLIGLAGNRPITHFNDRLQLEGEVQAFKHFGDQDHLEFTAGVGIRWQVAEPVSVAFFDGLSLATETPELEEERADETNPLLNYFALEVEVDVAEDWALAARIHHRSGVFGLFNGVKRGSNAYLFGVRHTL